jgi:hypothetical protein
MEGRPNAPLPRPPDLPAPLVIHPAQARQADLHLLRRSKGNPVTRLSVLIIEFFAAMTPLFILGAVFL